MKALAAAALAEGRSIEEAAELAGVSRQTVWRWTRDDQEFAQIRETTVKEIAAGAVEEAVQTLRRLAPYAVKRLGEALRNSDPKTYIRSSAEILKRIPELAPQSQVNVEASGTLEVWLAELDAAGETESD